MDTPADEAARETELLDLLKAGDPAAYEQWVRAHSGRMLAVARGILRHESDAQDAVQDAFLSAYRALDGFQGEARLSTWMHRITVNAALMKLRTRRRKPEASLEELTPGFLEDGHFADPPQAWNRDIQELLESAEARQQVREAVAALPETHRNVLLLRDIEGRSGKQAAEALGISEGAVKVRLHRARIALRELLDPVMRQGAPE